MDLAEQEARIDLLRKKAKLTKGSESQIEDIFNTQSGTSTSITDSGHVNLFQALEEGRDTVKKPNADYEKEKKEEQEKYEKQIGYLTYLGQDTNESLKKQDWYEEIPDRDKLKSDKTEVGLKFKSYHDPLNVIRKVLPNERLEPSSGTKRLTATKYEPIMSQVVSINEKLEARKELKRSKKRLKDKKKSKKHKSKHNKKKKSSSKKRKRDASSSSSGSSTQSESEDEGIQMLKRQKLDILRQERLKREQVERVRAEQVLAKLRGDPPPKPAVPKQPERPQVKQKYNSQFNPELARQNYDDRC